MAEEKDSLVQALKPDPPQPWFSVLTKHGLKSFFGPLEFCSKTESFGTEVKDLSVENARRFCWSTDGKIFAVATTSQILLLDRAGSKIMVIELSDVSDLQFSPKNSHLLVLTRIKSTGDNFQMFNVSSGKMVFSYRVQNLYFRNENCFVAWSSDERVFAHLRTSEIHFYENLNFVRYQQKLIQPNLLNFSLSPITDSKKALRVSIAVGSKQGNPGAVMLYNYPNLEELNRKIFFGVDEAEFFWSPSAASVVIRVKSTMDKKNKNYMDESRVYFFSHDGKRSEQIDLKKEGPIHEITWNPSGTEVGLIYGTMPAQITIFDAMMNPIISLGSNHRNTLKWSPNGKILMVGGFGALPGHMDIWDPKKLKKISTIDAPNSTVQFWSPDSRHILTAVLFPRMKVDNGIKIFKYDGTLVYSQKQLDECTQADWKPENFHLYPNKPYFVPKQVEVQQEAPKKYIPPHLRNKQIENPVVTQVQDKPQKLVSSTVPKQKLIVGEDPGPVKPKNAKKKKKPKKKKDLNQKELNQDLNQKELNQDSNQNSNQKELNQEIKN